uniref:Ribonuclease H-like domain-containing protein n=1 Tax=Tanacetum cinerariifolium TaxID=118510 RepID=A0A6L2MQT5_TANCI|nr:ribonuclease H-like domain-containing protein [Tanacetum cinerariifolium]
MPTKIELTLEQSQQGVSNDALNKVTVTKPHNKTPYELLIGRSPNLDFMRPFGCPVTILNTLDHLGKFEENADKGFLVGYSINRSGPEWLFNIDSLKKSMIYEPVTIGNQTNKDAGIEINVNAGQAGQKIASDHEYILLPFMPSNLPLSSKETGIFDDVYDDREMGAEDDTNNLELSTVVSPIPTTRVHKDHPKEQIIGDLNLATQTKRMINFSKENAMMDVKSAFLYGTIEEVFMCQPLGFKDPQFPGKIYKVYVDDIIFGSTNNFLCDEFEKMMHKRFQMSSMRELTFFLGMQTASTLMKPNKALIKDAEAKDQTTVASTLDIGEVQISTTIYGKVKLVSEASIRRNLKLKDSDGISTLPNTEIFEQLAHMGPKKTAWEQFSSNIATVIIFLATNRTFNISKMIFEGMMKNLDSEGSTVLVESYHTPSGAPTTLQPPLSSPSRIPTRQETKRSMIEEIDQDAEVTLVTSTQVSTQGEAQSQERRRRAVSTGSGRVSTVEESVSTVGASMPVTTAGMIDKGKGIIEKTESVQTKTKRQQKQERAGYEVAEDIQAKIKADEELSLRIQAVEREKYYEAEKARLLVDLINQRKRHFAQQRAKEKRNKPLTLAQQKTYMSNYVKHMGSHTQHLVKERFSTTEPTYDKEKELWVELKNLFEPENDDTLWKLQRYMHDPLVWRLYDTCGVHHVSSERGHDIFMLVEKEYPLTRGLMAVMLANKLLVEQSSKMVNELLRKIFILANRPRQ